MINVTELRFKCEYLNTIIYIYRLQLSFANLFINFSILYILFI